MSQKRDKNIEMESIKKLVRSKPLSKVNKDIHLHSPNHLLADELSVKFNDKKHFAFYLKMAVLYNHDFLRSLAGRVMESREVKTPGRLFAFLVKKHNLEQKNSTS